MTDINAQTPDQQARKEVDTKYSMSDYIKHENVSVTHFSTTKREELKNGCTLRSDKIRINGSATKTLSIQVAGIEGEPGRAGLTFDFLDNILSQNG